MEPRAAQAAVATVVPLPVPAPSGMPEQVMTAVLGDMSMSINSDCILSATAFAEGAAAATGRSHDKMENMPMYIT